MSIKVYQPERKELLINTEWGIPREQLAEADATTHGLSHFYGRWVSKEEERQLKDEAHAYRAIRVLAGLLLFIAALSVFWTVAAVNAYGPAGGLVTVLAAAALAAGLGLLRYFLWSRNLAAVLFSLMIVLPFVPVGAEDKGGPFFLVVGGLGLYYLFRKTAGKIFTGGN